MNANFRTLMQTFAFVGASTFACVSTAWVNPADIVQASTSVDSNALFSDQGPLYFTPQEPTSNQPITVTLRASAGNLSSANVVVYNTASGSTTYYPMSLEGNDVNGVYEFWSATLPATSNTEYYYFQANDGSSTVYYNASGATSTAYPTPTFLEINGTHMMTLLSVRILARQVGPRMV